MKKSLIFKAIILFIGFSSSVHGQNIIPGDVVHFAGAKMVYSYFPDKIDTLINHIEVLYLLDHESEVDSLRIVSRNKNIPNYFVKAEAIYLNARLVLIDEHDNDSFGNSYVGFYPDCTGYSYREDGSYLYQYTSWGGIAFDTLEIPSEYIYKSDKRVNGLSTECADSAFGFYQNGDLKYREYYSLCAEDGIWLFYHPDGTISKKVFYEKGVFIKEEEY